MSDTPDVPLGWSIGVLFRAWQDGVTRALGDLPHGARGFQILLTVTHDEPPTQAALAAHLGIDRTVLTYVLDDLVTAGLLERQVDAADRRVRRLAPTTAGRRLIKKLETRVAAAEAELLTALTPAEQRALRDGLMHAASAVHRSEPGHDACSAAAEMFAEPAVVTPVRRRAGSRAPAR